MAVALGHRGSSTPARIDPLTRLPKRHGIISDPRDGSIDRRNDLLGPMHQDQITDVQKYTELAEQNDPFHLVQQINNKQKAAA